MHGGKREDERARQGEGVVGRGRKKERVGGLYREGGSAWVRGGPVHMRQRENHTHTRGELQLTGSVTS